MFRDDVVAVMPDLRAFGRFLCRDREAADDLVQNTILTALDKQERFEPGTNLKSWLFTIMRNRYYGDLRAQRRGRRALDEGDLDSLTPSPLAEPASTMADLSGALWKLNPRYREALVLVGAVGFSYEEAAELCACSVGTLKARVSRARRLLAEQLG
ncbi:MAG: sigma-70 family RNA polymerase sigma factor [Rhodospirillales bacterium]|nr:MAG: sigma-70 family RNA polymerase sigma factor [Rhodospirillales bacterium]